MFLGDHAGYVALTLHTAAVHDDCHDGTLAPHGANHFERSRALANHDEVTAGDVAQADSRVGALQPAAQACVDAHHPVDVPVIGHHDVAQPPGVGGLAQIIIEARLRRQHLNVGVHHFAGGAHQEHVCV